MNELQRTLEWFQIAIPNPTVETTCVQIGCALEETGELAKSLGCSQLSGNLNGHSSFYKGKSVYAINELMLMDCDTAKQVLDDIVDEIVTRVGIAHCMGFDIIGALAEVNRSNFSKFEDGKPVFDADGKITKGKHYTPPQLSEFIGEPKA